MRTLCHLRQALALLLALVVLSAGGAAALADDGLAGKDLAAVPAPPPLVNCNLVPPYYENNEVNVSHSSGATSYQAHRATSAGGTYSYLGDATEAFDLTHRYDDHDVDTFEVHYYRGKACNSSGCSALSSSYCACELSAYAAPTFIAASDGTHSDKVRVVYNTRFGPSKYSINRSDASDGTYAFIEWDHDGSYDDTGATPGVVHYYRVRACTGTGKCGAYSKHNSGYRESSGPTSSVMLPMIAR